jgi:ABC-type antimicrobial peptide transport system permease subunit
VGSLTFYARTTMDSRTLIGMIPSMVATLDVNLPIVNLRTMDDQIWDNTTRDRVLSTLSSWFAVLATLLAAIGLYAVLAYGVAQRVKEIGIRMALGAGTSDVGRLVLSRVGRMTLVGGTLGAALALGLGRLGQAMLFGVEGSSPLIIGGAVAVVLTVALGASALPARRAASINPVEALRAE